jgi:subtilisin family serine protease
VTSAGNSGDTFYVSGSPGSATRAIATAATTDDQDITDGFEVVAPASAAGVLPASRSASFAAWSTPAGFSLTADLFYPTTNQYGCGVWTDAADNAAITGNIVLVDWKKPADATFPCGSAVRANNATTAGAVGIIMVDTTPWLDTSIAGNAAIPGMYSTVDVSNRLRSLLASGTVTLRLTNAFNNSAKLHVEGWNDTVSSFSSRGPQGRVNGLKPDLAAPGQGVFSTDAGTLSQGKSLNGTSMASPHVAGVMALLKQAHPAWTVEELKALAINTASQDAFTGLGHTGDKYGAGRVGAGRVNVPDALSTEAVASSTEVAALSARSAPCRSRAQTYERMVKVENLASM